MEKEGSIKSLPPIKENEELQGLFKFLEEGENKKPEPFEIKETNERVSYWQGVISNLNEYTKNGELPKEEAENYIARLVVLKEQSPGNDFLTKLPNRGMYEEVILREIDIATRNKYPLTLLAIDIDKLKVWNDLYEDHSIGDLVIIATAGTIKSNIRKVDFPSRYGGDEFTVTLPQTGKEGAQLVVKNILEGVKNSEPILGKNFSISIGIKEWKRGESAKTLHEKADAAAYKAKSSKDKFVVAED